MEPGRKYLVVFAAPGARKAREMVAKFLGETRDSYQFSRGQLAGTQTIRKDMMIAVFETDRKFSIPAIAKQIGKRIL